MQNTMEKVLKIAMMKAEPFSDTKEWCGAFTPSEIIALIELGVEPANYQHMVDYATERLKKGDNSPMWFYFYPNDKFIEYKEGKIWK